MRRITDEMLAGKRVGQAEDVVAAKVNPGCDWSIATLDQALVPLLSLAVLLPLATQPELPLTLHRLLALGCVRGDAVSAAVAVALAGGVSATATATADALDLDLTVAIVVLVRVVVDAALAARAGRAAGRRPSVRRDEAEVTATRR